MALRWIDGFELEQVIGYLSRHYTTAGAVQAVGTGAEFGTSLQGRTLVLTTPALVSPVQNVWVVGFRMAITGGTNQGVTSTRPYVALKSGASEQIRVEFVDASNDTGFYFKLAVKRGATVLGTTSVAWPQNDNSNLPAWVYFELKVTVRTGVNGSFELRANGVNVLSATGVNTANASSDGADMAEFSFNNLLNNNTSARDVHMDDIYVLDSTGATNNDFLGPQVVVGILPDGTGTTNQWVLDGGAASVQDALADPANNQNTANDDKRITSDVVGNITLATYANPGYIANTAIKGVHLISTCKMDTTGTRTLKHRIRDTVAASEVDGAASHVFTTTTLRTVDELFDTNPVTAAAWNKAALDGIQFGVKLNA